MMSWRTYVFNESTLVLEGVTLGEVVQLVVEVPVDLSGSTVLDEKTAEDTEAAHPEDLAIDMRVSRRSQSIHSPHSIACPPPDSGRCHRDCIPWHTSIRSTLPLTEPTVSANSSGGSQGTGAGTRVHGDGLADDETILDELADRLTGVGVGDFAGLVGVEPDLALSTSDHGGREALLRTEIDPVDNVSQYGEVLWSRGRRGGDCVERGSPRLGSLCRTQARGVAGGGGAKLLVGEGQ